MGSAQSYRAGLSISEKFESPDKFNHCTVRLNTNDVIVRLRNKTMKTFFLLQMFRSPMGYLASIMFRMPRQYFYGVSRDLKSN